MISPFGIDPNMMQQFQFGPSSGMQPFSAGKMYGGRGPAGSIAFNPSNPGGNYIRNLPNGLAANNAFNQQAFPGDQSGGLNAYGDMLRANMAYSADPQQRIINAQNGSYYLPDNSASNQLENESRYQLLQMAYAGNPMARINSPAQGSNSNNMTDVLSALAASIRSFTTSQPTQTFTPEVSVTPTSASMTSTTNPNIGMK